MHTIFKLKANQCKNANTAIFPFFCKIVKTARKSKNESTKKGIKIKVKVKMHKNKNKKIQI